MMTKCLGGYFVIVHLKAATEAANISTNSKVNNCIIYL